MVISQTILTKQHKLEATHITAPFKRQTHHMSNKASTIQDYPGQTACFTAFFHVSTTIIPYITLIWLQSFTKNIICRGKGHNLLGQSVTVCYDRANHNTGSIIFMQYAAIPFDSQVTKVLPNWNQVWMSFFTSF